MQASILKQLNLARTKRQACVVAANLADNSHELFVEGEFELADELGQAVAKALRTGKSDKVIIDGEEHFINAYLPPVRLVVIGAVHISQALAPIAKIANFDMEIIDPRTAFANDERFGDVTVVSEWPEDYLKDNPLDAYCGMVAVTHDPKIDDFPLCEALKAGCFYVGALGSRKTHAKRVDRLKDMGLSENETTHIHSPIGLDIGASSPQEIAVAIMAEIIETFRKRGL